MKSILFAAALALMLTSATAQTLYRWVDKDGKVQYTDMPPPADAKDVQQKRLVDNNGPADGEMPYATRVAKEKNPVTLYDTECKDGCKEARDLLNKRGIPYVEKNPSIDAAAATALRAMVGGLSVPTMVVGPNPFKGFDEATWQAALDTAGYPKSNPFAKPFQATAPAKKKPAEPPPVIDDGIPSSKPAGN